MINCFGNSQKLRDWFSNLFTNGSRRTLASCESICVRSVAYFSIKGENLVSVNRNRSPAFEYKMISSIWPCFRSCYVSDENCQLPSRLKRGIGRGCCFLPKALTRRGHPPWPWPHVHGVNYPDPIARHSSITSAVSASVVFGLKSKRIPPV